MFRIRAWIFYLSVVVFVAAVVIAIALPVTFAKSAKTNYVDVPVEKIVEEAITIQTYREGNIEPHDPLANYKNEPKEDPFEIWNVSTKAREAYARMDWAQKIAQMTLWAEGDDSGPGGSDGTGWLALAKRGALGSVINVSTYKRRQSMQKLALAANEGHGVPVIFGFDTIHGYFTLFPVNLGMAASWNDTVIEESVRVAAAESLLDDVPWTFSPMVDLGRDLRWGRVMEGSGEDAYLTGHMSRVYVKAWQGAGMASCVKHFGGYGFPESGIDYEGSHLDEAQLYNDYMRTYDLALQEEEYDMPQKDRVWTIMAAFNLVDDVPCHANRRLLTDYLRGKMKWKGFVVGDYKGVSEIEFHGLAENCVEAGKISLYAGVDMNMQDGCHTKEFLNVIKADSAADVDDLDTVETAEVEVNEAAISALAPDGRPWKEHIELAAKRVIAVKDALGLFDWQPKDDPMNDGVYLTDEFRHTAREAALQTMILLENNGALPIAKAASNRIVLAGRIPKNPLDHVGFWFGRGRDAMAYGGVVKYIEGLESYLQQNNAGTSLNTGTSYLPGVDLMITPPRESLENGNHVEEVEKDAQVHTAFVDFLREQANSAAGVTHVIAVVGENVTMTGESATRAHLHLGGTQLQLLREIVDIRDSLAANKKFKIIEVINAARPQIVTEWERAQMDAILMAWCPGTEAGNALPMILFGDRDVTGKTTMTWPRNEGQIPAYYSHEHSPRSPPADYEDQSSTGDYWSGKLPYDSRYIDSWNSPLYPFGYGKHYDTYTYSGGVIPATVKIDAGTFDVRVTVKRETNSESRPSAEIVQVYMSANVRQPAPPKKQLIGWKRVAFTEGITSQEVTVTIDIKKAFSYFDQSFKKTIAPGTYDIYIGKDSDDETINGSLELQQ